MQHQLDEFTDPMIGNDKYLYHYTSLNRAFEHILHEGKLLLASLKLTNDPRESKDWNWTFRNISHEIDIAIPSVEELVTVSSEINLKIKRDCKLCCFSIDDKTKNLYSGRGWGHPRMWAQYADKHKGVCLVFDKDKLIETAKKEFSKKGELYSEAVNYLSDEDLIYKNAFVIDLKKIDKGSIDHTISELVKKQYKHLFFTKHTDWKQEVEFRILLRREGNDSEFLSIENSIAAIIMGVDFPVTAYQPLIDFYCKKYKIPYGTMKWHNGKADLRGHSCTDYET